MRLSLVVLISFCAAAVVLAGGGEGLEKEFILASTENGVSDISLTAGNSEAQLSDADSQEVQEAVDALDVCQTRRCAQVRSRCSSIAQKRVICRQRIRACRKRLAACPNGTSHCLNIRRRIIRLVKRYRYFGGRLRTYLRIIKHLAWGPKRHTLRVPKYVLEAAEKKKTNATSSAAAAKKSNTTSTDDVPAPPRGIKSVHTDFNRLAKNFSPKKLLAKKLSKGPRLLPLPYEGAFRRSDRRRKEFRRLLHRPRKERNTWWGRFLRRAVRPARRDRIRAARARAAKGRKPKKVVRALRKIRRARARAARRRNAGFWRRLFKGRSRFMRGYRHRKALRELRRRRRAQIRRRERARKAALARARAEVWRAGAPERARRRYWTRVWNRLAKGRVSGHKVWDPRPDTRRPKRRAPKKKAAAPSQFKTLKLRKRGGVLAQARKVLRKRRNILGGASARRAARRNRRNARRQAKRQQVSLNRLREKSDNSWRDWSNRFQPEENVEESQEEEDNEEEDNENEEESEEEGDNEEESEEEDDE